MKILSTFRDIHRGKPAAILGGGPSLEGDAARLPAGCVLFAVNHHAALIGIQADYLVYNDDPDEYADFVQVIEKFQGIRLSPHKSSDVLFDANVWTGFYSSNTATWLALYMGCDPVILCGMDCYQGPVKYCHPRDYHAPSFDYPLDDHLRPWREEGIYLLPHVERVRVMSGPLMSIFRPFG